MYLEKPKQPIIWDGESSKSYVPRKAKTTYNLGWREYHPMTHMGVYTSSPKKPQEEFNYKIIAIFIYHSSKAYLSKKNY